MRNPKGTVIALSVIAILASLGTAQAIPVPFTVDAFNNSSSGSGIGLNTGLSFVAGDVFTVTVDPGDLWNAGALPRWSNADGLITNLFATGTDDSGEAAGTLIGVPFPLHSQGGFTAPFGSLVGSLGGTFFLIGTNFNGPAPASGILELFYWDSNNFDNTEFITALVDPTPAPVPATLPLLGIGLTILAWRRRRS